MLMRALIIDDSTFTRRFLEETLTGEGFDTIDTTGTGVEARALLKENRYDCVLLDIILEDANGMELLDEIRERDTETPVIMVSVVDDEDRIDDAFERGANGFISKPLKEDELRETLSTVL